MHDTNLHETFWTLYLTIIFIKPCNSVTVSISFLNEISFVYYFLSNKPSLITFYNLMNFKTLTNWLSKDSEVIFFPKCFHLLQLCGELTLIFLFFWSCIQWVVELEFCHHISPACESCVSIFDPQWMLTHTILPEGYNYLYLFPYKFRLMSLSVRMFLLCFIFGPMN